MAENLHRINNKQTNREEETADRYLRGLGANWDDFVGKRTLDIGSSEGDFADAARRRGVDVTSFDIRRNDWNRAHRSVASREGVKFVQGSAEALPFADESFDVLVSHAGPFGTGDEGVFREAHRILKTGGVLRLGPMPIFPDKEPEGLPDDFKERMAAVRERSRHYVEDLGKRIGFSEVRV